jgi:CBS domain-containing protein
MRPHDSVIEAVRNMIDFDTGAIAVLDHDRKCVGVFSKKDLLGKVVALGRDPKVTRLGDVMTADIVTAADRLTVEECMRLMVEYRIRHLVLVNAAGEYTGLLGLCDLLGDRIFELTQSVLSLEGYLNDAPGG